MTNDLIVLPVYNRESAVLDRIHYFDEYQDNHTLLIIDDGSSDTLSENITTSEFIHYIKHEKPLGYGGAVMSALEYAEAHNNDTIFFLDITNSGFREALGSLKKGVGEGFDIVSVSRFEEDDVTVDYSSIQAGRIVSHHLKEATGLAYSDFFSPFKALKKKSVEKFTLEEFDEAVLIQLWVQALHFGLKTAEMYCSECKQDILLREAFENDDDHYINFIKGEVLLYPV